MVFFHDVTHAMDKVNFENSAFYNPDNENDSRPFNKIRDFFLSEHQQIST